MGNVRASWQERPPISVASLQSSSKKVALLAFDLLARIKAMRIDTGAPFSALLDALAIDDGSGGAGFAFASLTALHIKRVMNAIERAVVRTCPGASMAESSVALPPAEPRSTAMSVEKLLKTAAYFEDRANRSRRPEDKDRFLAVAKKYPVRAEAVRKREADLVGTLTAPSGQWIAAAFGFVRNLGRPRRLRLYYTTSVRFPPINPDVAAPPKVVCPPAP